MDPRITSAARYQQQKNYPAAEQIYRRILLTEPKNVDALLLLGLLLHETSRNEESVDTLYRALKVQPQRAEVRKTLVGPLMALGRIAEAIVEARELVRLRPLVAETHYAAATLLLQAKDLTAALPYAKRAVELQPKAAAAWVTLGRVHHQLNQTGEALTAVDRALALEPNNADALIDKAVIRQSQGQLDEAIVLYEAGLRVAPRNVAALNNLGSCFLMKTRSLDAVRCFEAAAEVWPTNPKPRNNVGAVLKEMGLIDQAIPHFRKALELDPTYADGYVNIGASYATVGEHRLSIEASRQALRLQPDYAEVRSNLLMSLLPPTDISEEEIFAEHVEFDRAHARHLRRADAEMVVEPTPNRRLRIGYISADFREHSVRYFIQPILAYHDRSQFEIFCYATGRRRDEVTEALAKLVDSWQFVAELTNQQLADLIRSQRIDILVDLAGHTSDHRLLTFAYKPAPVQVTYLGYPTTTGLSAMDYRLTDAITDLPGSDRFYTEKLVRLPHAFFVYSDEPNAWFDPALPADRNGFFTFGSFNSFTKINDETLDSWATILRGVPNSRLFMKARPLENPSTRERVIRSFAERGVTEDRLTLRAWVSLAEHTTMLGSAIDLMLDTYPYNGHTTSCQAIWRGVPVVTRSGDSFRSRVGECIMRNLDLPDFVGKSKQEYEQTAIRIAGDLPALRALRPTLQQRMRKSPLFDAIGFTRSFEGALKQMLAESSAKHWVDRALQLHHEGELTKAVEAYQAGLALEPNHLAALNNLGACYLTLGRVTDGIQLLEKAAQLNPTEPRMRNNIGTALEDLGKFDEAIEQYKAAYAIDPTYAESLNNLGAVYGVLGKPDLAIASYREALRVRPDFPIAHSNLLMSMLQQSEIPEQQVFDEHLNWAAIHTKGLPLRGDFSDSGQHRRLRIGYVSPDFREHSVRRFIEPVLAAHDRSQFEVFCYAVTARQDTATSRLKSLVESWRFVAGLDDAQLAEQIRADGIDILIDLAGHTSEHRLLTFARSPAPVQVTYLGYPATTGLAAIQYRMTDSLTDPSGSESFCTEQLVRLPHAFFTYEFDPAAPYEPSLPADRNGYFTFGSFNNFAKINLPMLQLWADILMAVPGSRLILKAKPMGNQSTKDDIVNFFSSHGIDPSRLDLIAWVDSTEHQRLISGVDLALDPFPYHGHTTSCESIWMGVPFVTRAGNTFRSRVGVTILHHLDLIDFIADSEKQYVEKAIRFASDLTRLRELRPILRDRMRASPLCDAAGFTRSLEHAYREMWRTECEARLTRR